MNAEIIWSSNKPEFADSHIDIGHFRSSPLTAYIRYGFSTGGSEAWLIILREDGVAGDRGKAKGRGERAEARAQAEKLLLEVAAEDEE